MNSMAILNEFDWENQLQNQSDDLRQLTGTLIYGTFRCVSGGSDKGAGNCGEVLIERGPRRGNVFQPLSLA